MMSCMEATTAPRTFIINKPAVVDDYGNVVTAPGRQNTYRCGSATDPNCGVYSPANAHGDYGDPLRPGDDDWDFSVEATHHGFTEVYDYLTGITHPIG